MQRHRSRRVRGTDQRGLPEHHPTQIPGHDDLGRAFGRAAEPWEVAARFLASDYSSYLTGEVISVSVSTRELTGYANLSMLNMPEKPVLLLYKPEPKPLTTPLGTEPNGGGNVNGPVTPVLKKPEMSPFKKEPPLAVL